MLARLLLASSFTSSLGLAACADRTPQIIQLAPATTDPARVPGGLTVTGSAILEVSPDCADVTMTLTSEAARPGLATTEAQGRQEAAIAALLALGLAPNDLKLSHLTLDPVYDYPERGGPRLRGYRAAITLTATTKRFDKLGAILEAGATAGATSISTAFRRSDLPELKKQVRAMALAAAKDKAKQISDAVGIELGQVVSVAENQGGAMWRSAYFPQVANAAEFRDSGVALGGALQPLSLDITIAYELPRTL
jgi:uncharacterized protein